MFSVVFTLTARTIVSRNNNRRKKQSGAKAGAKRNRQNILLSRNLDENIYPNHQPLYHLCVLDKVHASVISSHLLSGRNYAILCHEALHDSRDSWAEKALPIIVDGEIKRRADVNTDCLSFVFPSLSMCRRLVWGWRPSCAVGPTWARCRYRSRTCRSSGVCKRKRDVMSIRMPR